MGSVAKAVTKTISGVVGWVGDAVVEVGEFLYDDIIKPVAGMVEGVVQGALDDPLGTIAVIGAGFLCGPPCAAAAKAAVVAINGGNFEDILLAAATTYIGGEAGAFLGDFAGEAVSGALGDAVGTTASKAITLAAEGAAKSVTKAVVRTAAYGGSFGENVLMAAASGAITSGVGSLLNSGTDFTEYTEGEIPVDVPSTFLGVELPDMDVKLSDLGIDLPDMNLSLSELGIELPSFDITDTVNDVFGTTYESVKLELGDLSSGFGTLPETAQSAIAAGASASISTYLLTGELNEDVVAAQMFNAAITSGLTRSLIQNNENVFTREADGTLSRTGDFLATTVAGVLSGTVNSAFTGSDPSKILSNALTASISRGMNDTLKDLGADALEFFDEVTGAQSVLEASEIVLRTARTAYESLAQEVNAIGEELSPLQGRFETTREEYFGLANTYNDSILPTLDNLDTVRKDALAALDEAKVEGVPSVYSGQFESDPPGLAEEWALYGNRVAAAQTKANTTKKAYDDYLNTEVISRYEEVMDARSRTDTLLSELEEAQEPYKAKLEEFTDADDQYVQEQEEYRAALQGLANTNEVVNTALEPVTAAANKSVVEALTQDPEGVTAFNPDEYKTMYGLTAEENPYEHWLTSGRSNFINEEQREGPPRNIVEDSINQSILNNPTALATEQSRADVAEAAIAEGTAAGYPPELLLNMAMDSMEAFSFGGEWGAQVTLELSLGDEVTNADILEGNAFLVTKRSDSAGDSAGDFAGLEGVWTKEAPTGAPRFDPYSNEFVTPVVTPNGKGVRLADGSLLLSPRPDTGASTAADTLSDVSALQKARELHKAALNSVDFAGYHSGSGPGFSNGDMKVKPAATTAYNALQDRIIAKYGFCGRIHTSDSGRGR